VLALLAVLLTFQDDDPVDREAPWDFVAVSLAATGCAAAFFGAGYLEGHGTLNATSLVPLCAGFALIVVLILHQYHARQPLMPVKRLATTLPVTGIVIALFESAAAFGLMSLTLTVLQKAGDPAGHIAVLFLPELAAAALTAIAFGLLFRTRFIPVLAVGGVAVTVAAGVVATSLVNNPTDTRALIMSGLIGIGVGASVSPALFLAGFSLRSSQIQRVFGLIELLRGVAAFLAAPILAFVVTQIGSSAKAGTSDGIKISTVLAGAGFVLAVGTMVLGRSGLQTPDLESWQEQDEPAWHSPPLFSALREPAARRHGKHAAVGGAHASYDE
jgi:hypothetical protein